jgi:hypothetical protein
MSVNILEFNELAGKELSNTWETMKVRYSQLELSIQPIAARMRDQGT